MSVGPVGYVLFSRGHSDAVGSADVVVVLGGEHDGREYYGLELARTLGAKGVLLSDPYGAGDPVMDTVCRADVPGIDVECFVPDPSTTQGEAAHVSRVIRGRGWRRVVVVTWDYHVDRARYVFRRCVNGDVSVVAVPGGHPGYTLVDWYLVSARQLFGMAKAAVTGC
ncbi:YdcF family protein [Gordonia phthalatica]|uniref:YdcF family protein n=1 Tax=Gordonia phthalatica TaxID=1136941 RepID=UPI001D042F18|nr:YdcF family protein [Gordonia phthalatica]